MGFLFQTTFCCSGNLVLFQYDGEEWRRSFWRSLFIKKRSPEIEFAVSDDLLPYQQPCSFPRLAGEG